MGCLKNEASKFLHDKISSGKVLMANASSEKTDAVCLLDQVDQDSHDLSPRFNPTSGWVVHRLTPRFELA